MNNLNEMGEFDSLFKSAAIDYELPFNEGAWNLMEQKLDKGNGKRKFGLWFWLPITALVLSVSLYAVINSNTKNNVVQYNTEGTTNNIQEAPKNSTPTTNNQNNQSANTETKNTNVSGDITTTKEGVSELKKGEINNDEKATKIVTTSPKAEAIINKKSVHNINEKEKNIEHTTTLSNKKIVQNIATNSIKSSALKDKPVVQQVTANNNKLEIPKSASSNSSIKNDVNTKPITNNISLKDIEKTAPQNTETATKYYTTNISQLHNRYIKDLSAAALKNKLELENIEAAALAKSAIDEKEREERLKAFFTYLRDRYKPATHWYLTAAIGGNIGYVSNPAIKDAYLQYQFGIGYNISKYVSVQTGVGFGKRTFNARKDQYFYKGPFVLQKYFKSAAADIDVIDIPITFRYQFSDIENQGWYTTMGFSTLFMPKDFYRLTLDPASGLNYLDQNFEHSTEILGLVNISVGYQFPMKKSFTLMVEPYLQLPFQDIGGGGVKLSSIGVQVGMKYNFPKKKK